MNRRPRLFLLAGACVAAAMITLWPAEAAAQRGRVIHRPATTVVVGHARPAVRPILYAGRYSYYRPYYYRPYYYPSSFYLSFWFGNGYDWWDYPYYYQYPYPRYPYRGYYEAASDLRIQVTPRSAEVYLDGYLVGTVDNFDGVFQRLRVPYGEHEIEIYLDGFRTIRERMLFRPGETYHIRQVMQPLNGQPSEPRPTPRAEPRDYPPQGPPDRPRTRGEDPVRPPLEPRRGAPVESAERARGMFGTLALRVQPVGAEVLIDGERWDTAAGEARLVLDLAEGTHRIEIRKEGYKPYTTEIRIRRGETLPLNVVLPHGD